MGPGSRRSPGKVTLSKLDCAGLAPRYDDVIECALTLLAVARLVKAKRVFAHGGLIARLVAGGFHRLLDRTRPGWSTEASSAPAGRRDRACSVGRGPGPRVEIHLKSWRALARARQRRIGWWYRAWVKGEWTSPDPVALLDFSCANGRTLGQAARARARRGCSMSLSMPCAANSPRGARKNIAFSL